ncbi:MAG: helix-turn-helix domain-containing protein [Solirubrobacteraceae bacterium]
MTSGRCRHCGTPLAQDNAGTACAVCQHKRPASRSRAPEVPSDFWETDAMAAALASGDLGRIILAYRAHPFHGRRALSQTVVADWLHVSQTSLSRIEHGRCRLSINEVAGFSRALGLTVTLRWNPIHEAGEDVDPLSRRSLLGAGAGAALGLGATTAPAAVREIDPRLVSHWMQLLRLLGRHDAMWGPHEVLDVVRHELDLIAASRQVAGGELQAQLLRVESRWSGFASSLSDDAGNWHLRDAWADRCLRLAREGGYPDMAAYVLMRQSQWSFDPQRVISIAEQACRLRGPSDRLRGLCALKEARGHALAGDVASCERRLADAYGLLDRAEIAPTTPWDDLGGHDATGPYVLADEARCWLWLQPQRAVGMFEDVLRLWPGDRARGRGIHQAHLARACASAGEPERAAAEGMTAIGVAHATKSDVTKRELKRLDRQLAAYDVAAAADFREAFATL